MRGPPQKSRHNAKARQSVAGGSSHKKRRSNSSELGRSDEAGGSSQHLPLDSNREVIDPTSKEEQEWKLKEQQRRELLAASQNEDPTQKLSSKKRKRLDAYIASRLKKEARAELLAELAQTSAKVREGRQDFVSSRTLGTGKGKSAREIIDGKAVQPEAESSDSEGESYGSSGEVAHAPRQPPQAADERPTGELLDDPERRKRIAEAAALFSPASVPVNNQALKSAKVGSALAPGALGLGSALARGSDGEPLMPVMRKRKRKGPSQRERRRLRQAAEAEEASGSDFDSSDESDAESLPSRTSASPSTSARALEGESSLQAITDGDRQHDEESDDDIEDSDDTDSEEEAILMKAMKKRGLQWPSAVNAAVEATPPSVGSGIGVDTDRDTDSEEEAVLMEAMRRRGIPLPSEDEESSDDDNKGQSYERPRITKRSPDLDDSREASRELGLAESAPGVVIDDDSDTSSLPWEGFADEVEQEEDAPGSSQSEAQDSEAESSDEDQEGGSSDPDDDDVPSRRRGIQRTDRSSGFKDWARAALGFGGAEVAVDGSEQIVARTAEGTPLLPVAGLSVKVGETGPNDGVARGPLGERESSPASLAPFASKYYEEVASSQTVRNIPVNRSQEVIEGRLRLPVVQDEERVVKTILENEVTVICGETGSGKTTQVAQMLFERGFGSPGSDNPGMVGITQPRRVAAVSTARRVAEELNLGANRVSHQIRYDGTVSPQTSLKFMTDGVLLREVAADLLLSKYSVIIVDEAHERSVNTDVLIGMVSRVVRLRANRWMEGKEGAKPLRLVIMSATLRVADFVENPTLFNKPPPLLNIEARQHPVTVHFNRKTTHDYVTEAVKKATKIHTRLPPGGILIFMTGEQEIKTVCKRLEAEFGRRSVERRQQRRSNQHKQWLKREEKSRGDEESESSKPMIQVRPDREDIEAEDITLGASVDDSSTSKDLDTGSQANDIDDADALDTEDEESEEEEEDRTGDETDAAVPNLEAGPMHILPLYSLLPAEKQLEVFKPPPEDARLVVVATNVAETSLTIPNVRYVIDCGRAKERKYDTASGISSFKVDWISKASASQRAGRAGRTGPGHCYRLFSSNVFEEYFDEFAEAEIRRTPVEGLVLQMKSMNIDNVVHFPFPTAPDRDDIAKAERILTRLGALSLEVDQKTRRSVARITELGKTMALFPLNPRYAKMLVQGQQHGCLPYIIALVAALSVGELFVRDETVPEEETSALVADTDNDLSTIEMSHLQNDELRAKEERKQKRRRRFEALEKFDSLGGQGVSDAFRALAAVGACAYAGNVVEFCRENFLKPKAMEELKQLQSQLSSLVLSTLSYGPETVPVMESLRSPRLPPPNATQLKAIRQLIACAYIDQVAVRADLAAEAARSVPELVELAAQGKLAGNKWRTSRKVPYLAMGVRGEAAYIHPSSAIFEHAPPEWCVFSEVTRSKGKVRSTDENPEGDEEQRRGRVYLRGLTKINPGWIAKLGKDMCSFSKPTALDSNNKGASGSLAASIAALKSGSASDKPEGMVIVTPTYGTGPACEPSERAGQIGWELPPIKAVRRWVGGSQGWSIDL